MQRNRRTFSQELIRGCFKHDLHGECCLYAENSAALDAPPIRSARFWEISGQDRLHRIRRWLNHLFFVAIPDEK